jgi:hypothetical protein
MESTLHYLRYLLITIGIALLAAGGLLLLWGGQLVYQVINQPEQVRVVQFILERITVDAPVVSGTFSGAAFELSLSDSAKTFGFVLLGVFAVGALAGVVKALLLGGIEVIKGALSLKANAEASENSQNNSRVVQTNRH